MLRSPTFWILLAVVVAGAALVYMLARPGLERVASLTAMTGARAVLVSERADADEPITLVRLLDEGLDVVWEVELEGYAVKTDAHAPPIAVGDDSRVYVVLDRGSPDNVSRKTSLIALDGRTGARDWETPLAPVGDAPFDPANGHSPLLVAAHVVIAAAEGDDLSLQGFDRATDRHRREDLPRGDQGHRHHAVAPVRDHPRLQRPSGARRLRRVR